jgi:ribosome-binding protein aMBF1 (putative translation factor)
LGCIPQGEEEGAEIICRKAAMKLHCHRCGHDWNTRYHKPPKVCPTCKRPDWNIRKPRKLSHLEELVQRRFTLGIKQQDMADRIGVSVSYISGMERGIAPPTAKFYVAYNALPSAK